MGRLAKEKGINFDHKNRNAWAMQLWPHFKKKGLKSFNMDQVAMTLGKSKATVYKYFQSRKDILEIVLSQILSELVFLESILGDKNINYEQRYLKAIELLCSTLGGISAEFLLDLKKFHPDLWESIDEFKEYSIELLKIFYLEGKSKKLLGATSIELLVLGDEIFLNALLDPKSLMKNKINLEEGLRAYFENKMFGMLKK